MRSKCESESDSVLELTYCCYNKADLGALVELAEFPQREGRIEMRGSKQLFERLDSWVTHERLKIQRAPVFSPKVSDSVLVAQTPQSQ